MPRLNGSRPFSLLDPPGVGGCTNSLFDYHGPRRIPTSSR